MHTCRDVAQIISAEQSMREVDFVYTLIMLLTQLNCGILLLVFNGQFKTTSYSTLAFHIRVQMAAARLTVRINDLR